MGRERLFREGLPGEVAFEPILENEQALRAAPEYGEGFGYRSLGKGS